MKLRRLCAIAMCGILGGSLMSIVGTAPATARIYVYCDNKIDNLDRKSTHDYEKGKITLEEYEAIQAEIAAHRELWNC